jgi:single-stranded DNA-specific DHH superfamily exonuclease
MNERIDEIAFEAGCNRHKYWDPEHPDLEGFIINYAALEKFAELIVRECARVAIEKQTENDVLNIVSKNPAKDFAYALIEHFGIES